MKLTLATLTALTVFSGLISPVRGAPAGNGEPTLVTNVRGYTLASDTLKKFSGLLYADGRVLAVGDAAALQRQYPAAHIIDGHGKTLLPGLIDAHGHIMDLGFEGVQIQLFGTLSLAAAQGKILAYAKAYPDRPWLLGGGWNQVQWKLGRFPTAQELDAEVADRPVVLDRVDGHAKWLNTKALQAAGITKDTPDPVGGSH